MLSFCSSKPDRSFKYRSTMTQPYCYWQLNAPFVNIIGLYSNVDGLLDARGTTQQLSWLIDQLKQAPRDKWLIVAVHHPCFSLDDFHGGYPEILSALDSAFAKAGRNPDAVLSGHVHNYQRFARNMGGVSVPYIVAGNGGFANTLKAFHKMQTGLQLDHLPLQTSLRG